MAKRIGILGSIGARLALTFVAVALGAIALFAGLVLYASSRDVSDLTTQQQGETASAVAHAVQVAYVDAGGWKGMDLDATITLATAAGAKFSVFDTGGRMVARSVRPRQTNVVRLAKVTLNGQRVGTVRLAFSSNPAAVRDLRHALVATIAAGAGLAALLALAVSVPVARRITRPLGTLIAKARAVEAGDRGVRVADVGSRGEVAELAVAFNRMADAIARQDDMRRTLVADVAHELRTPLTIVRGTLEGLIDGVTQTTPARLSSVHDDILRLTRLVEDLEMLAAADAAGPKVKLDVVDLAHVAEDAVTDFAPQFEAADVHLSLRAEHALVGGDPHRLRQVISNLLTNALKFTPAGGLVTISVKQDSQFVHLAVADTGIGIPSEERERIFDRFWRGPAARGIAGSGIGLTVVSELASAHGGAVRVESEPGHGTVMTVSLPAR
jgi:two-component system sensor histidine kinase BaeS